MLAEGGKSTTSNVSLAPVSGALLLPFRSRSLLLDDLPSLSFLMLLLRFASACFRERATRSLWHAMHQIPCEVLAKMSSSILLEHERQRKQSAW